MHIEEKRELMTLKENVLNVEQYLKSINTIQGKNVKIANVRKVTKVGKADTFNMEVQDVHNFIANGIIVHNSIDAERYLISEWQSQGKLLII